MSSKKMCSQMGGGQPWWLPRGKFEPSTNMEPFYLRSGELFELNIDSFYLNMEPFCVNTDFFY